jgi:tRNA1Val (adenine37-N6)-methyltransferase
VILPIVEGKQFVDLSEKNNLYCSKKTAVFPNPEKPSKRLLLEFRSEKCNFEESELTIEAERHVYTTQYSALVKDFYLKL